MLVPSLLRCKLFVLVFWWVNIFDIRFLAFSEKVLSQQVENRVNALMGVVLAITFELFGVLAKDPLEQVGTYDV